MNSEAKDLMEKVANSNVDQTDADIDAVVKFIAEISAELEKIYS